MKHQIKCPFDIYATKDGNRRRATILRVSPLGFVEMRWSDEEKTHNQCLGLMKSRGYKIKPIISAKEAKA